MQPQPIQWATGAHSRNEASTAQLINMFVEQQPRDSKEPVVLYNTPGTALHTELPTGPIQGAERMLDELYVITDSKLYEVKANGSYTELGDVTIRGRCDSANNGTHVVFVDGRKGYAYSKKDGLKELSGPGWSPADTVAYLDGYFIFNDSQNVGEFFISSLLGIEFDALDFATAEGSPDDLVAVFVDHRELWLGGRFTTEVWYNQGGPDFPMVRMEGAYIERGIIAPHSYAKDDNTVFWLGEDGIVYRANGYTPQRISTHAVEADIAGGPQADAYAFTYTQEGHVFYVLTFPSQKRTWCFDISTGEWHIRAHFDHGRHVANAYADVFGLDIVGDFQSGRLYQLDRAAGTDNGRVIQRKMRSPTIHAGRRRAFMAAVELDMESGHKAAKKNPEARLRYSDDGGNTWSNERPESIGKVGEYLERVKWYMLGTFRQRVLEVTITEDMPIVVMGAYAEIRNGQR